MCWGTATRRRCPSRDRLQGSVMCVSTGSQREARTRSRWWRARFGAGGGTATGSWATATRTRATRRAASSLLPRSDSCRHATPPLPLAPAPRCPCAVRLTALRRGLPLLPSPSRVPTHDSRLRASHQLNPSSPPPPPQTQVAAGSAHSLALCAQGRCHTFGRSHLGQCGHRSAADEPLPRCVASLVSR